MPRKTKGHVNTTTFSNFEPGTVSSPKVEKKLKKGQVREHIMEHTAHLQKMTDADKKKLELYYEECYKEFDDLLKGSLETLQDIIVTPEVLKQIKIHIGRTGSEEAGSNGKGLKNKNKKDENLVHETDENLVLEIDESTLRDIDCTVKENGDTMKANNSVEISGPSTYKKKKEQMNEVAQTSFNDFNSLLPGCSKDFKEPSSILAVRTPNYSDRYKIARVTPGPDCNKPISILRRQVPGEMALSMNGSPILLTSENISEPQMNIPLANGRVMTIIGNENLNPDESILGEIDPVVVKRLAMFKKVIDKKTKTK